MDGVLSSPDSNYTGPADRLFRFWQAEPEQEGDSDLPERRYSLALRDTERNHPRVQLHPHHQVRQVPEHVG